MSNFFVVIRKSLAKAFDPLYESPVRNSVGATRLTRIEDVSPPINVSASPANSEEILQLNNSIEELSNFIEDIIDEALSRVVPEIQENIIDIETDILLEIENSIGQKELNVVDDLLDINVANKSFDLEDEILKISNAIEDLDLTEVNNKRNDPDSVNPLAENLDLKHEINITGLDVTSEYKSANTTLHEIEDIAVARNEGILDITQEKIMSKIIQELNSTKEVSTETEPIDPPQNSKIIQELNSTKEVSTETEPIDPPQNENREFVEKNNLINRLSEEIANKDLELIKIKNELAFQISNYESLQQDCDNKNTEILGIKLELEKDRELKENYVRLETELQEWKLKCNDYDNLERSRELKENYVRLETELQEWKLKCNDYDNLERSYQEKHAELAAKYEEAIKRLPTPAACNTTDDEAVEKLKKEFSAKEKEYECILSNYAQLIEAQSAKYDLVNRECSTAKQHLANLEIAFTDVHQKYEKSKTVIEGYKANEEKLKSTLVVFETTLQKYNEQLEKLKRKHVEENNTLERELKATKEDYITKVGKFQSKIKHLEIKVTSLSNALDQKNKECQELTKLCEECFISR
ncbi:Transforming acidic coiled-coil-containing protein (TACC), C-terminal [Popillia japonica]|uniref:Transforming acidic coiled-coil-containing protein (TACC), C-terminal n=1 Tax=Popillia japonica TaxID=7064 RepID=A0AAW1JCM5_POPJA